MSYAVFIIVALIAIAIFLALRKGLLVSSSLDISSPPLPVRSKPIGKSTISEISRSGDTGIGISMIVKDVSAVPLGVPEETTLDSTLISLGDPRTTKPSRGRGSTASFELQILIRLRNDERESVSLLDIKAHVYHVSMYRLPLADMGWAPRVELAMDNTANLSAFPVRAIPPGHWRDIRVVFETSVFDTLFTTIVFGLVVQCSSNSTGGSIIDVPSDRVFILQHEHSWETERAHFVARDLADIDRVAAETGSHAAFFDSLRNIYRLHVRHESPSEADRDEPV